jgi:hypothetical protein
MHRPGNLFCTCIVTLTFKQASFGYVYTYNLFIVLLLCLHAHSFFFEKVYMHILRCSRLIKVEALLLFCAYCDIPHLLTYKNKGGV